MTSPAVSQHLKVLRHVGLVHAERRGYFVPYAVNAGALNSCCGMLVNICAHPGHSHSHSSCECRSEADRLIHRREQLLRELQRIETALEELRSKEG